MESVSKSAISGLTLMLALTRRQFEEMWMISTGWNAGPPARERELHNQGRNHGRKVEGTKVWVSTPGRLRPAPDQRPGWVLGMGVVAPSRCKGPAVSPPENFFKTQMLNTAFWWVLAVKFLASWKLRPRSWGTNTLLVPNLKVGDQSPPGPYGCCAYVYNELWVFIKPNDWTWLKVCVKGNVTNISKLPAASAEKTPRRIKTPTYLHTYIGHCIDLQAWECLPHVFPWRGKLPFEFILITTYFTCISFAFNPLFHFITGYILLLVCNCEKFK